MKKLIGFILIVLEAINANAQITLNQFVEKIDWLTTEANFVYQFYHFVEPSNKAVWVSENTESNFHLKNIFIGNEEVLSSYSNVRVLSSSKELFRINLIMMLNEKDNEKAERMIKILYEEFGEPNNRYTESSDLIDCVTTSIEWIAYDSVIKLHYDNSSKTGILFAINIEPRKLQTTK